MELQLFQSEIAQVSSLTCRNTLKILPSKSKKKKQKFAIGDDNGILSAFQMKKGEAQNIFKSISFGSRISCLELGGSSESKDKIFVGCGQKLVGITKKGKEFFKFQSNLTETINSIAIDDTKLFTCTDFLYNQFDNGIDKHSYMCSDRINAFAVEYLTREKDYNAILGCQDKTIRILEDDVQVYKKSVSGALSALSRFPTSKKEFLYATEHGEMGHLSLKTNKLVTTWKISGDSNESAINCIDVFDLTKDGTPNIMIGRNDGKVQVYSMDSDSGIKLAYEYCHAESIRGINSGVVSTSTFNEVLFSTYSGKIVSLTTEPLHQQDSNDAFGRTKDSIQKENRIQKLRKEISSLEEKILKEKEKNQKPFSSSNVLSAEEFSVNSRFLLDTSQAAYVLSVEIPMSIDLVALQSSIPLNLLNTKETKAIVTRCRPDPENFCSFLATYRCQEPTNRLEIKLRSIEGQSGDLSMTVITNSIPKSAQTLKFSIKPLSLHNRIMSYDEKEIPKEHTNMLILTGTFSLIQIHEWISMCLPSVPERLDENETELELLFKNVFLNSNLFCKYKKGEASFSSLSVSALAIIKETITKEAIARKIHLNIRCDLKDQTIEDFLQLIHPKITSQLILMNKVQKIEAIKEIHMQEKESKCWMSTDYQEILEKAEELEIQARLAPTDFDYISGILSDYYIDFQKLKGRNMLHKLPELKKCLKDYNYENLLEFFQAKE